MPERSYWLDLFTGITWREFLEHGGQVSGFRDGRWSFVQKIEQGDYLLCYLTGLSRFIGVLEVTGRPFKDDSPIWSIDIFPSRLPVKVVVALKPETAVPILALRDQLSIFKSLKNPNVWQGAVRSSPYKWDPDDGQAVIAAIRDAESDPVIREFDPAKLRRRPAVLVSKQVGDVTVPEEDEVDEDNHPPVVPSEVPAKDATVHTEIQWLLLKLGSDMGLSVWVPASDKGKEWRGKRLDSLPGVLTDLPLQFDDPTNKVIRNIDVLWIQANAIEAAFEIESTTAIYSGLLRMSDLLAMQPNINIPLFLVAPDERRSKVISEVNRATFSRLATPLLEVCRYIPFSSIREHLAKAGPYLRYLKPDFLQELSESCEPED